MNDIVDWVATVHPAARGGAWQAIERGGSDRQFWRGTDAASGLVAVAYGLEKAENARYADCAEFLLSQGVRVPRVVAHDASARFLLLEDAGAEDLWAHREKSWPHRRALYASALEQVARLHASDLAVAAASGVLQVPFDENLYRWEQEYFFDHFLGARPADLAPCEKQAEELAARPRVLLHRDFQSQNIMVQGDEVTLIDFQGMRAGLAGYDVASLLYDPYVAMDREERNELSNLYFQKSGRSDVEAWTDELLGCARQRLMQALGAYGFLGRVKGRAHFLSHIPAAAERLASLCDIKPEWRNLGSQVRAAASQ